MAKPLDGIRVLDLTQFFAGPQATLFLAGLGAEVIAVDHPVGGNRSAGAPPFVGPEGVSLERRTPADLGIHYLKRTRAKKAVTLDLKQADGFALFKQLLARCDVLVENFSVGVTARLNIDYESLRGEFPGLVYCSVTGFGSTGPDAHLRSYDIMAQAASGLMSVTGRPGDPPLKAGSPLADAIAGTFAMSGILAALLHHARTGEGQHVDISMVDCLFALLFDEPFDCYEQLGMPFQQGNRIPRFSPLDTFGARDGWLVIAVATPEQWIGLCKVMGRADLAEHAEYSNVSWRIANTEAVTQLVADWARTKTVSEAVAGLRAADVVAGPIHDIEQLRSWPHLKARGMWTDLVHPGMDRLTGVGAPAFPIKLSATPGGYDTPAPVKGQHNDEIYGGLLGLSAAERLRLRELGVI